MGAAAAATLAIVGVIAASQLLGTRVPGGPPPNPAGFAPSATESGVSSVPPSSASTSPRPPVASVTPRPAVAGAAPTSARGFRLRKTVVAIRFPLKYGATYSYANNFLVRRAGTPLRYNHAWSAKGSTVLHRAHDGVDINVRVGAAVLAPFDGVVIDPSVRWTPWRRDRYGIAAIIESREPTSRGYVVILAHLSRMSVKTGASVRRSQVIGFTGRTGNAEATVPHLHVELRAPFRLPVTVAGKVRRVDAFDPYPSLVAADPKRKPAARAPTP